MNEEKHAMLIAESNKFAEISKRWPTAVKFITTEGLLRAYAEGEPFATLSTWKFEAKFDEKVQKAVGGVECPKCKNRVFVIGQFPLAYTVVDFSIPFVHGSHIRVFGRSNYSSPVEVWCYCCRRKFP